MQCLYLCKPREFRVYGDLKLNQVTEEVSDSFYKMPARDSFSKTEQAAYLKCTFCIADHVKREPYIM